MKEMECYEVESSDDEWEVFMCLTATSSRGSRWMMVGGPKIPSGT